MCKLTEHILHSTINFCKSLGLDTVGWCEWNNQTVLSIAFPYYDFKNNHNGFSIYAQRSDYHKVVHNYLNQIRYYLEIDGECYVDNNNLPERYIATIAGIGFIGKNNMLITEKYGSFVFLGEIIFNKSLINLDQQDKLLENKCNSCTICVDRCPTNALGQKNINICLSHLSQQKVLTPHEETLLKQYKNIFGCDICQLCCPYNKNVLPSPLKEFETINMDKNPLIFANMTNKYFKDNIKHTSAGWRGKNVIKRNALFSC
ncbi:hypothetical protein AN639_08320 [Candidatus Epulonipiscium fishelsonii]|uniref:Uncharacterized protein n=1 Tax=Candidatus Epulonipiscium fishelsonii TaxID=77094 RepID=A0ACC8XH11_9FIRM|nr:hypothetical protein AN639_08320 [Epulopiscium sp. SCG-B05WGA-EpuloA1]ONI43015.1 hypothetical protein AN396_00195 [Epulopiscium sp. SCG-B11WGA-EpuloA1]